MHMTHNRFGALTHPHTTTCQARKYAFRCHRSKVNGVSHVYPVNAIAFHPMYDQHHTTHARAAVHEHAAHTPLPQPWHLCNRWL